MTFVASNWMLLMQHLLQPVPYLNIHCRYSLSLCLLLSSGMKRTLSTVALKIAQTPAVQFMKRKSQRLFGKYLLVTNTTISITLSGAGDVLQQRYEKHCDKKKQWQPMRTRNQAISGAVIGPSCHFWYKMLDHVLPGRAVKIVLYKVVLDQIIMSPVCVAQFLAVTSWLEGKNKQGLITEFRTKGVTLLLADWVIWPPAQMLNFFVIPPRFRVLYDNTVSLAFDWYYSYVKYRKDYSEHSYVQANAVKDSSDQSNDEVD